MSRMFSDEISSESWTAREGLFDEKEFSSLDKAYTNFYGEKSGEGGEEQTEAKQEPTNDKAGNQQKGKSWDKAAKRFHAHTLVDEPCPYCNENSLYKEPLLDEFGGKAKFMMMGYFNRSQRYICVNPKCRAYYGKHKSRIMRKASGKLGYSHPLGTFLDGNPFHIDR